MTHVGIGLVGQAEALKEFVDPVVVVPDAEVTRLDAQRLADVEERVEHQFLRHDAELPSCLGEIALDVESANRDRTRRGPGKPSEHADQGGLARAVGAEQPEEFALLDLEGDVVDRA